MVTNISPDFTTAEDVFEVQNCISSDSLARGLAKFFICVISYLLIFMKNL